MKNYLNIGGKTISLVVFAVVLLSGAALMYSHDASANRLMDAVTIGGDDGGGGGAGGTPNPGGGTGGYTGPLPNPSEWPKPGETKTMQWCTNGATASYRGVCSGTTYRLYKVIPAHDNTVCTQTVTNPGDGPQRPLVSVPKNKEIKNLASIGSLAVLQNPLLKYGETTCTVTHVPETMSAVTSEDNSKLCPVPCTSAANACGQTANGFMYNDTCLADIPPTPPTYGKTCTSASNACGQTTTGTFNCSGACTATAPANPSTYGSPCTSPANSCGEKISGTVLCDGTCSAKRAPVVVDPSCGACGGKLPPPNFGSSCASRPNSCGMKSTGRVGCTGLCNAVTPSDSMCKFCKSAPNACGATSLAYVVNGVCTAVTPENPVGFGTTCVSKSNSCGMTNSGSIDCKGNCSVSMSAPDESLCSKPCTSGKNACGETTSGMTYEGVCNAITPPNPPTLGAPCKSAPNSCDMAINGTINCNGVCSAITPPNSACPTACKSAPNACGQTTTGLSIGGKCNAVTPPNPKIYIDTGSCVYVPPVVNGACGTTIVDNCTTGFWQDRTDTSTQYLWTCKGSNGGKDASCAINKEVIPDPSVSINPVTSNVKIGQTTTFSWSATNATYCQRYENGVWKSDLAISGSFTSDALTKDIKYKITCVNVKGDAPYKSVEGIHDAYVTALPPVPPTPPTPPKPPVLTIVERPVQYESIAFGEFHTQRLVIRNDGELPLIGDVSLRNDNGGVFKIVSDLTDFNLDKGATKSFNIQFTPKRNVGAMNKASRFVAAALLARSTSGKVTNQAEILIKSNDVIKEKTLWISGTGVEIVSGPNDLNVGDVPAGLNRIFKYSVRNNTLKAINACLKFGQNSAFTCNSGSQCSGVVGSSSEVKFNIAFKPSEFVKLYTDNVTVGVIDADGSCKSTYDFEISGKGVKPIMEINEL